MQLKELLKKPLITGASLSADRSATSPGKTLALRYTEAEQIRTIAHGGRAGRNLIPTLPNDVMNDRSIIIALDLFFWDSTLNNPNLSLQLMSQFVNQAKEKNLPIVLGEIPELLPSMQPNAKILNEALRKSRDSYAKCFLMPFNNLRDRVMRDGYLKIDGKKYGFFDLLPDGLHLSKVASDYLAGELQNLLQKLMDASV